MRLKFTKMHGAGNDYVYFDCFDQEVPEPEELAIALSHRRFAIGGDGIVLIEPSGKADARMRMFNRDGSEGEMCGNAIRCVGKYLYEKRNIKKDAVSVETASGVKNLKLLIEGSAVNNVTVDMGKAILTPAEIPVSLPGDRVVGRTVNIAGGRYEITCVSMGNPHCVVFCDDPYALDIRKIGPLFENDAIFPRRVNTEFVRVVSSTSLIMRVWERGSGETWACGTGACACAVAAVENGYCSKDTDITVRLKGGDLVIRYTDEAVAMTGPAVIAFEGVVDVH